MIVLIAVVIILLVLVVGGVLALAFTNLDKAAAQTAVTIEKQDRSYNPAITLGYKLPVQGDPEVQLKEARRLAAQQAAALPRGANMRIGNLREQYGKQPTAFDGVQADPITAVKIASVHGWDGVRSGIVMGGPAPAGAAAATAAAAPAATGEIELVPGKDYPVIEITDDMPDAEKRKARIANAKAKSAAMKAAKASGQVGAAAPAAVAAPAAAKAAAPAAVGVPEPVFIEITDDMSADEVRKARIANSKAKAAYNKALKAAGVDPAAVAEAPAGAAAAPAPAPAAPAADAAALAGIPKPDLIEITDDMPPDEVRKARIANSKANAAYNKALKAAGIDPSAAAAPAPAAAPAAPPPSAAPAPAADAAALAGIPKPDLIEITDDMPADEVRRARIANAKATSAYNKALKAAGIDPSTVN